MPTVIRSCSVERNGGRKASNRRIITRIRRGYGGTAGLPDRRGGTNFQSYGPRGAVCQDRVAQNGQWGRLSGYGRPGAEPWSALLEGDAPGPGHACWDDRPGEGVAVGTRVAPRPPPGSRRAAFPHRALIGGRTSSVFGTWQSIPAPMRRLAASVTCLIRRCVRDMRCLLPSLRSTAFPPQPPPLLTRQHCSALHRYYAVVRLLGSSTAATPPRLPTVARDRLSDCGRDEVSQVPTRSFCT